VPSSVTITNPANGSTVTATFPVSIDYSNGETATVYVLLKCNHTGAHSSTVATVAPGVSGTVNPLLTHLTGFTGVSLEARLQLTQTWGDNFINNSIKSNITISDPVNDPGGGT
jgi:hypothetical protein